MCVCVGVPCAVNMCGGAAAVAIARDPHSFTNDCDVGDIQYRVTSPMD